MKCLFRYVFYLYKISILGLILLWDKGEIYNMKKSHAKEKMIIIVFMLAVVSILTIFICFKNIDSKEKNDYEYIEEYFSKQDTIDDYNAKYMAFVGEEMSASFAIALINRINMHNEDKDEVKRFGSVRFSYNSIKNVEDINNDERYDISVENFNKEFGTVSLMCIIPTEVKD